jgi:hypothetical protein
VSLNTGFGLSLMGVVDPWAVVFGG